MPISQNPRRNARTLDKERQAESFIAKAGTASPAESDDITLKPIMLRFPAHILQRIDREAKRLGITRTAFVVQSAVRELDRTEGGRQ